MSIFLGVCSFVFHQLKFYDCWESIIELQLMFISHLDFCRRCEICSEELNFVHCSALFCWGLSKLAGTQMVDQLRRLSESPKCVARNTIGDDSACYLVRSEEASCSQLVSARICCLLTFRASLTESHQCLFRYIKPCKWAYGCFFSFPVAPGWVPCPYSDTGTVVANCSSKSRHSSNCKDWFREDVGLPDSSLYASEASS